MASLTRRFGPFTVEITTDNRDPSDPARGAWTECWVSKGRATSSLAVVEDFGAIAPDEPDEAPVPAATIAAIRALAEQHGY